jgi:hypothetical protein
LLVAEEELLGNPLLAVLVVEQTELLAVLAHLRLVVAELNLLVVHLFLKLVQHCKAALLAQRAIAVALVAVVAVTLAVALVQIQTPVLVAVVALVISIHHLSLLQLLLLGQVLPPVTLQILCVEITAMAARLALIMELKGCLSFATLALNEQREAL